MLKQKVYLYVQAPHHEDTFIGDNAPVQWFSNWVLLRRVSGSAKYWRQLGYFVSFCNYTYRPSKITLNHEYEVIFFLPMSLQPKSGLILLY
jgi:hypothetical protein